MKIWKQLPFLLSLTLVATGFRTEIRPLEESFSWASESPEGKSIREILPLLEDMLGQIERSKEIPEVIAKGPQVLPSTIEELQKSPPLAEVPATQTTPKTSRLKVGPVFDLARFGNSSGPVAEALPTPAQNTEKQNTEKTGISPVTTPQVTEEAETPARAEPEAASSGPVAAPEETAPAIMNPPIPVARPEGGTFLPAGTTCVSCGVKATNLAFMQCSSKNNYLESEISKARESGSLVGDLIRKGPQRDSVIKPQCLRSGMVHKLGEDSRLFRKCEAGANRHSSRAAYRPCVSENYYSMIANSFDLVARCMAPLMGPTVADQKRDIRAMFGMFTVESGMHLNAMSPSGAGGFGQLTQDAIQSVNEREISDIRRHLKKQGGLCERLADETLRASPPMRSGTSYTCDRISIQKGNPLTNLVYSMANVLQGKQILKDDILTESIFKKRFDLTSADQRRLLTALSVWSHNSGIGGMKKPLISLLNSTYRNSKVTDVDKFLKQMKQAMLDYPHRANRGASRKRETSRYYTSISAQLSSIEANAGGGSCLGSSF